jgi:hypothetical protein
MVAYELPQAASQEGRSWWSVPVADERTGRGTIADRVMPTWVMGSAAVAWAAGASRVMVHPYGRSDAGIPLRSGCHALAGELLEEQPASLRDVSRAPPQRIPQTAPLYDPTTAHCTSFQVPAPSGQFTWAQSSLLELFGSPAPQLV